MTNGEKIQTILNVDRDCTEVHGENGTMTFTVTQEFWNAEYKEPVLDKIRAEIEKLQKMCDKNDLNLMAQYSAFGMVLDILDKYKTESEGE